MLTATYADDTAILAINKDPVEATVLLQNSLRDIENWAKQWRIKLNETKSAPTVQPVSYTHLPDAPIQTAEKLDEFC